MANIFTTKVKNKTIKVPAFIDVEGTGEAVIGLSSEDTYIISAKELFKISAGLETYNYVLANTKGKEFLTIITDYLGFVSSIEDVEYIEDTKA